MMKRFLAAGVLALCLFSSNAAHAIEHQDPHSLAVIKATMVENYLLWQEAYRLQDAERIISFESPDFTSRIGTQSVRTKEESDEGWRSIMRVIQNVHQARMGIKKMQEEPKRVMVLSRTYLDVDVKYPGDKNIYRLTSTVLSRDTWVLYNGIWMLKRMEQSPAKVTINGKPQP